MSNKIKAPDLPGQVTREMLFHLMALARDVSFPDAEMRAICESVTYENINDTIHLLRRLHALKPSSASTVNLSAAQSGATHQPIASVKGIQTPELEKPALSVARASSEPGAVLCAATFYALCEADRDKLQTLSVFCPFSLAYQQCVHGQMCQLRHICWLISRKRRDCFQSHKVLATCNSVFDGTRCPRTKRIVGNKKKKACPSNHDFKARLFMGAMRTPHRLGFYGVRTASMTTEKSEASREPSLSGDTMTDTVDSVMATESEKTEHAVADLEHADAASLRDDASTTADLIQFP